MGFALALSLVGCDTHCPAPQVESGAESPAPRHFSWVVDEQLAGMAHPGIGVTAEASFDYLASRDVTLLVSLTEQVPTSTLQETHGIDQAHMPVVDYTAPSLGQLDTFVTMTAKELHDGGRVAVHCAGGHGRTGTFLAAWFVAEGMSAAEAIDHVRALRPGSIETYSQLSIIGQYADTLE
ncbi:MAG: dual specificity protein phosphatase family protein [Myxococcota bacterium]|nr:dual specificity protein phosphatase family protein [Myxococcota bacterium]